MSSFVYSNRGGLRGVANSTGSVILSFASPGGTVEDTVNVGFMALDGRFMLVNELPSAVRSLAERWLHFVNDGTQDVTPAQLGYYLVAFAQT